MADLTGRLDLRGHRVLITGAGRGIGRGMAEAFADWGARLAIADVSEALAEESCAAASRKGAECVPLALDVTREDTVAEGVATAWEALGGIDLLVNNAGVLSVAEVANLELAEWNRVMAVNATGVFLMSRAVVRLMRRNARPGSIVSVASIAGKRGDPGLAHYSASKFAVVGFTQALAREVGAHDITVNAVCPGVVRTEMIGQLSRDTRTETDDWVAAQAIPCSQTPRDIAFAAGFLHLSRAITGQSVNVDGGTLFH